MEGELGRRLGAQACAVVLVLGSIAVGGKLTALWRLGKIDKLKAASLGLALYPAVMGWLGLIYLLEWQVRAALWTVMTLVRAGTSLLSLYYIKQALGKDTVTATYSENRLLTLLVTIESAPACLFARWRLGTVGDAKQFLQLQSLTIYQYALVCTLSAVGNAVLELATGSDWLEYACFRWDCGWVYLALCLGASGLVAAYGMCTLGLVFAKAKDSDSVSSLSRYFAISMVATNLQEFVLTAYAQDNGPKAAYMHGFLLSMEMSACAFSQLFLLSPPLSLPIPTRPLTIQSLISPNDFSQVELSPPSQSSQRQE